MVRRHEILQTCQSRPRDEYYTRYQDIAKEIWQYPPDCWRGKIVYCNCDDPFSNFVAFFIVNFQKLGLKRFISTGIRGIRLTYDGQTLDADRIPSGDFRHNLGLVEQSDVVVTNPPFSLVAEHIMACLDAGKDFLVIAPVLALSYQSLAYAFVADKFRVGHLKTSELRFLTPDGTETGVSSPCCWLTTFPAPQPEPVQTIPYDPDAYRTYANYDAIDVPTLRRIPDCDRVMGVPVTFLPIWRRDQYEVIKISHWVFDSRGEPTRCFAVGHHPPPPDTRPGGVPAESAVSRHRRAHHPAAQSAVR